MPDQTAPLVPGFSVQDLADPETIRKQALRLSGAVTAEQAAANFRAAADQLRQHAGTSRTEVEEIKQGIRTMAEEVGDHARTEADRG